MTGVLQSLKDVPAGAWTLLVAILGFGVTGWKDHRARLERDDERKERKEIREQDDARSSAAVEHANAQHWREMRLAAIDALLSAFIEYMKAFEKAVPDHKNDEIRDALDAATKSMHEAELRLEARFSAPVVKQARTFMQHLNDVLLDARRWSDLGNQPSKEECGYDPFDEFGAVHHWHDMMFGTPSQFNALIELCRQELGIIEYRLPELRETVVDPHHTIWTSGDTSN